MIPTSGGSKPRKHSKTFTGCWTCRARKVKCDEGRPVCMQCLSKKLECGGYGLRLHWLPPEQGSATSHQDTRDPPSVRSQRSRIPFELRRRALNDNQIDHILASIDEIDPTIDANTPERQETLIHNFGVFDACLSTLHSLKNDGLTTDQELFHHTGFPEIASPPSEPLGLPVDPSPPETSFTFVSDLSSDHLVPLWYPSDEEVAFQDNSLISPAIQELTPNKPKVSQTSCDIDEDISSQRGFLHVDSRYFRWREPNGTIMSNPSPTYLPPLEQFLLHHYMRRVVRLFCIIDNMKSPWQRIHLTRTLQSTGEMNIEGSTSHIQHALRNALLSISAFTLSNDSTSRGNHDEANRWANEAMIFRGKTFKLLKDSVERGFQSESSPKYKDYLATMLSMISINVMSGDTSTCGVHLDGAFHFMKCARNWKVNYSSKARSLHRIYFYLRTIYESTVTRRGKDSPSPPSPTSLMIPEFSETVPTDQVSPGSHKPPFQSPESCIRLSYECIYGVPHHLLVLLEKTTNLILTLTEARENHRSTMIPVDLVAECDRLESEIIEWPLDMELDRHLLDDTSPSSMIIRHTARAFHNALIIYFAQHIRLVSYRYLKTHIECVLDCIEVIETIKLESDCFAGPLYWPAFIAASEAFEDRFQSRFRVWYEQVEHYGIAAVRTGISILTQVWKNGPEMGCKLTSQWRMEVERNKSILMLS